MESGENNQMTKREKEILEYKAKIKELKLQGSFKYVYQKIRKATLEFSKNKELSDKQKLEGLKTKVSEIFATNEEE